MTHLLVFIVEYSNNCPLLSMKRMNENMDMFRFLTEKSVKKSEALYKEALKKKKEEKKTLKEEKRLEKETTEKIKKPKRAKKRRPDPSLETGKVLPHHLGDYFPKKKYGGQMIEEIDPFYKKDRTFLVINTSKTIFRFSSTNAFFIFSPFNPVRKVAIKILTHPMFTLLVLVTIIANCVIMAMNLKVKELEYSFTAIYTAECVIKAIARGLIINKFTYMRDPWNWLDFIVIGLAYLMFSVPALGKFTTLRSLRVLRALKTVTTIPGMKTVVGALLKAITQLRDVIVLTIFMLSIFALIGLQLYRGTLLNKCVKDFGDITQYNDQMGVNATAEEFVSEQSKFFNNKSNWQVPIKVCHNYSGKIWSSACNEGYVCFKTEEGNPNYGYTNFDNFPNSLLCAFRLMTQDFWENLYQITIRANGDIYIIYFMMVIFFGSFYLVNVILAIVAMSYDSVRQANMAEDEEEETEKKIEEEKRELFLEDIEKELDATSDDLIFQVLEGVNNSEENISIKSCYNHSDVEKVKLRKRAQSFQWNAYNFIKVKNQETEIDSEIDSELDIRICSSKSILQTGRYMKSSLQSETNISSKTSLDPKTSLTAINKSRYSSQNLMKTQRKITEDSIYETRSSRTSNLNPDELERLSNIVKNPDIKKKLSMISIFEAENKVSKKEIFQKWFMSTYCSWECCPAYNVFKKIIGLIVLDPFMEMYITLCIVFNTFFMAIDAPLNNQETMEILKKANYFFTATFTLEASMKLIAHGPREYFSDRWNIFDFIIVGLSLVEIPMDSKKMSLLRTFRLLRVFKLAKSWQTMNMLFTIIGRTLGAIGNLCIVLGIIIFIFAVVGMQIFGEQYELFKNITAYPDKDGMIPRWNFCDFIHSFMIVFRVLCGEYIESMWDCIQVNGPYCVPFFLLTMILANLVILNLFLALLLSSFGSESLQRREDESSDVNKLQEAFDRIYRAVVWIKIQFITAYKFVEKRVLRMIRSFRASGQCRYPEPWNIVLGGNKNGKDETKSLFNTDKNLKEWIDKSDQAPIAFNLWLETCDLKFDVDPEVNKAEVVYWNKPVECLPYSFDQVLSKCCKCCIQSPLGRLWWWIRCHSFLIVDHRYFETFILIMIAVSSLALTLEDKHLAGRKELKIILDYLDKIFTIIFTFEMILKWFAIGFTKYFKDPWCWLDFVIVMIALVSLGISLSGKESQGIGALKALRTLRALRPLRAVSRWEGMRLVVNALIQAIPSICNVLLVCLVFWLIFSIIGMQLFGGKFYKCINKTSTLRIDFNVVDNKSKCLEYNEYNVSWVNSKINFDNVLNGYLALFQVATFKGWMEIMADAVDVTELDQQPRLNNNVYYYLYFVLFITFGSFFTLNLFIGVIIDNFNVQKKKVGGSLEMFMTEDQKKYYNAMKKMSSTAPQKPVPRPKSQIAQIFYNMISNQRFDLVIMGFIMLNTIVMCVEHHNQGDKLKDVLEQINRVFVLIFTGEAIIKLIALRLHYFKIGWNIFDFIIVIFSIIFWAIEKLATGLPISPTLIRVVRVFRIGRVLRLIKSARGIRTLLFSLIVSLPALFNIALLLMMIMFIYAIVGMSFFSKVPYFSGIDETFNFETFGKSVIILFQISTSGGWNYILDGLTHDNSPACADDPAECAGNLKAVIYLVSYLVISFLVIVNMYIAVILENFSQATNDVQQGLTQDDYDLFYECWENYDIKAIGFINLKDMYDFVDKIGKPLGIPKPNKIQLAILEIPICKGDTICCVDLLDILTKNFLGNINVSSDSIIDLKPKAQINLIKNKIIISDTFKLQQENWAAFKITYILRQFIRKMKEKRQEHIECLQ